MVYRTPCHNGSPQMNALTPATVAPLHPVRRACIEAALKLNALQPTRIVGEPDMDDAKALVGDIEALWAIIDPIMQSVGEYAEQHFGPLDMTLFTDCLRCATEGQATFEIESAAEAMISDRHEGAAESAVEFRRA